MEISTTTLRLFEAFGCKEGIKIAAEIGFDALDLSLTNSIYEDEFSNEKLEDTCKMLREEAERNGIYFNQAHAPFPSYILTDNKEKMDEYNNKVRPKLINSIKAAGLAGAEQIIVHPIDCTNVEGVDQKKFNIDFYNSLIPYCKEYNIKIALENMWKFAKINGELARVIVPNVCSFGKDLAEYYDALDSEYFTVCLDVGHCALVDEKPEDAIIELGHNRLHALHVHDNDGKADLHTFPYLGILDWDAIMGALKKIDYDGVLTFEVIGGPLSDAYANKPALMKKAHELLSETGKFLANKF